MAASSDFSAAAPSCSCSKARSPATPITAMVGAPRGIVRVVPNGISTAEMVPVAPRPDAADLVSVGEFRHIKGTDVLIDALAELAPIRSPRQSRHRRRRRGRPGITRQVARLGLATASASSAIPRRGEAFAHGRLLVMPSRADSLPYVVIEAGGAGIPIIASGVGGIPEILGPDGAMVPPDDPALLAKAIAAALDDPARAKAGADAASRAHRHAVLTGRHGRGRACRIRRGDCGQI